MSEPVITVENLSKKYMLKHLAQKREHLLSSLLVGKMKSVGNFLKPAAGSECKTGTEDFWALKDVSFEIGRGDRVGIIGRNGAGKSTLLKILSRITEPTKGRVTIDGRVASLLEVGTGFHSELSGRENIYLNGAILGMGRDEIKRKFDEIVAFAEVERFLDTPVKRYSSGMYVRLAFAVAAHLEPEILIIDEVLAVGDAQFQKKCLWKMEDVSSKEGRTVLFVSHNMEAIKSLCNQAICLKSGEIWGKGSVNEQIDRYVGSEDKRNALAGDARLQLGSSLELRRLEFSPNPIESMGDQEFLLEFWSPRPITISAITILFYSSFGARIAVMDFRHPQINYKLNGENPLQIRGIIRGLPLVEGDYRIGLYIDTGEVKDNFLDLLDLTVTGKVSDSGIVPYPASVRGVVELDYDYDVVR